MSRYRIAYDPVADAARQSMDPARRTAFESELEATIGADPYGHGSTPVRGETDRRDATIAGAIIRYYVSGSILTITIVRLIH